MNAVLSAKPHATDPQSLFKARYGNYIGGEWVAPRSGQYFDNTTPVTGPAGIRRGWRWTPAGRRLRWSLWAEPKPPIEPG